jgi:hypothetical protein
MASAIVWKTVHCLELSPVVLGLRAATILTGAIIF